RHETQPRVPCRYHRHVRSLARNLDGGCIADPSRPTAPAAMIGQSQTGRSSAANHYHRRITVELKWETSFDEALDRLSSLIELIRSGTLSVDGKEVTAQTAATLTMEINSSAGGLDLAFGVESKTGAAGESGTSPEAGASGGWPGE